MIHPSMHAHAGHAGDRLSLLLARIAVAAGKPIADLFARQTAARWKPDSSPVTDADLAAEALILDLLERVLPGVPVVSEERAAAGCVPAIGSRFILVDPLDGTREFIARRAEFTVNIALIENRRPVAGAVYAPLLNRLWYGGAESRTLEIAPGAELGDAPRSTRIAVRRPPAEGLVALVSRSHADAASEAYLAGLHIAERRAVGSSLKFAMIAEGQADVYPRLAPTQEWDTAAGHAVLAGAGGAVLAPGGEPLRYGNVEAKFLHRGFVALGGSGRG